MNKNGLPYTILFTFLVSFILVLPLSLANEATKPQVATNRVLETGRAVLTSLGVTLEGKTSDQVLKQFNGLQKSEVQGQTLYKLTVDGKDRWSSQFAGPGLWGSITIAIGFSSDLSSIVGFKIVSQSETPGLGGRIEEPWFQNQFTSQSIKDGKLTLNAIGTGSGDPNKQDSTVDGITGATRTTEGVRDIVNNAIVFMKSNLKGGQL